jgi:hypothetical protein
MPNTLYNITAELHEIIQAKAEKYGVDISFLFPASEMVKEQIWTQEGDEMRLVGEKQIPAIQAPQIRQILLAFKWQIGLEIYKFEKKYFCFAHCPGDESGRPVIDRVILPLFDREPETVLSELLEILKAL